MADNLKNNTGFIKKLLPYILAIVAFIIIGYAYAPYTLEGRVVNQSDISSWMGMSHEITEWNGQHPDDPTYWTNSMFSGMPATTISVVYKGDYTKPLYKLLFFGQRPASYLIISLIGAFLMFLAFGVNFWLAIMGAIAVTFCSYNMQIIQVGHNTKMIAIAFMPWVIAALVYAYRKNALLGGALFGVALSFQIKANHPQISYYLAIIVVGYIIWQLCKALQEKWGARFLKTSLCVAVAGLLGIGANINHLWSTYEYGKHTMRGGSELTEDTNGAQEQPARKGLDLEYATQWSYGIEETPNLFIPNFNGGASGGALTENSETYKVLRDSGYGAQASQIIRQLPLYWGPQPFTAGPMYIGAVCVFLFILGLFVVKGGLKWWIAAVSAIAVLLCWGYHFMAPTKFFYYYMPLYNKFRTVSMILVILQITVPVLGIIALDRILKGINNGAAVEKKRALRGVAYATAIAGGFALIFALMPSLAGSFVNTQDSQMPSQLATALAADRASLLRADALRSLVFVLLAALVIYLAVSKKLQKSYVYTSLIALIICDLWVVDKRYLNSEHFVTQQDFTQPLTERPVDKMIANDTALDYRVLDLTTDPFNSAYPSFYHKTIGGYSPAKLQRYQDLIDRYLYNEMNGVISDIRDSGATTIDEAEAAITYHPVLSMLNTKYIIIDGNGAPLINRYASGDCWFVNNILKASGANEEIELLSKIDPANTAVVESAFIDDKLQKLTGRTDTTVTAVASDGGNSELQPAAITLTSYAPNRLKYHYSSASDKLAVFSQIYYPGWSATLNGKPIEILRADWVLRALYLPAGKGNIEFYFAPESFTKGAVYSRIASALLLLLLLAGIVLSVRRVHTQ